MFTGINERSGEAGAEEDIIGAAGPLKSVGR